MRLCRFLCIANLTLCVPLASCSHERIRSGDSTRHYLLHLPPSVTYSNPRAPLILVFHGMGGSATGIRRNIDLDAEADRLGWIVAYLEGSGLYAGWSTEEMTDLRFVQDLIAELSREHRVDSTRVFAVGYSIGGRFVQRLACESNIGIRAFASIAATTDSLTADVCLPRLGVSALFLLGTRDLSISWDADMVENPTPSLTVEESIRHWARVNECSLTPTSLWMPIEEAGGSGVEQRDYADCKTGSDVLLYVLPNQDHGWPNVIGVRAEGDTVTASRLIAEFFESSMAEGGPRR